MNLAMQIGKKYPLPSQYLIVPSRTVTVVKIRLDPIHILHSDTYSTVALHNFQQLRGKWPQPLHLRRLLVSWKLSSFWVLKYRMLCRRTHIHNLSDSHHTSLCPYLLETLFESLSQSWRNISQVKMALTKTSRHWCHLFRICNKLLCSRFSLFCIGSTLWH